MASCGKKLEYCEVCCTNKAKYTCPKCEVRTCCITCLNIHKKELECDGIRDKTKFIPLKSFTDLDVLSDYRFLEEAGRTVDRLKRNPLVTPNRMPKPLSKIKWAACRRKVILHFMPPSFSRRKDNTTFYYWAKDELYWKIEWIFPQAENIKWDTKNALDTTRLSLLVDEVLYPVDSLQDKNDIEELNRRISLDSKLKFYQAAGFSGVKVLLKAEKVLESDSKFYELDITQTLKENLEYKTIIEFPKIYIILKDHLHMYKIIDTDDEDSKAIKDVVLGKRKRKNDACSHLNPERLNSNINYFFPGYTTDSEDEEEKSNNDNKNGRSSDFNIPAYDELVKMEQ